MYNIINVDKEVTISSLADDGKIPSFKEEVGSLEILQWIYIICINALH